MKKLLCLLLGALLVLPLLGGCMSQKDEISDPVTFYYLRKTIDYTRPDGVIAGEIHSRSDRDPEALLTAYLSGIPGETLSSPFPSGTRLVSLSSEDSKALLVLGDEMERLTGLELSLASTCLVMTAAELLSVDSITLRTPHGGLNMTLTASGVMLDLGLAPA